VCVWIGALCRLMPPIIEAAVASDETCRDVCAFIKERWQCKALLTDWIGIRCILTNNANEGQKGVAIFEGDTLPTKHLLVPAAIMKRLVRVAKQSGLTPAIIYVHDRGAVWTNTPTLEEFSDFWEVPPVKRGPKEFYRVSVAVLKEIGG